MRKMSDWFIYRVESESIRQTKNNFYFETRYSRNAKHNNSPYFCKAEFMGVAAYSC